MVHRRAWLLPFAFSLLTSVPQSSFAQPPYLCTATAAVVRQVRPQGLTELVGDLVLSCSGVAPQTGAVGSVTVTLNNTVTNRLLSGTTSDALLLVDEPAPGSQTLGVNLFQGNVTAPNAVTFTGIPFADAPGGQVSRTLRITNIRAAVPPFPPSTLVVAFASIVSIPPVPLADPQHDVAGVASPVAFSVTPQTFTGCAAPQDTIDVQFAESNANDLKTQGGTGQSLPGAVYNTETGFTPDPVIAGVGTADSGTELFAMFTGIPSGVSLSVPPSVTNGTLTIIALDPPGGGSVSVVAGTASVVYEVTASNPVLAESVSIPVTVSYSVPDSLLAASVQVQGGLATVSTVATASNSAPVPRFADLSTPQSAFSISPCREIPTMNAQGAGILILVLLSVGILVLRRT